MCPGVQAHGILNKLMSNIFMASISIAMCCTSVSIYVIVKVYELMRHCVRIKLYINPVGNNRFVVYRFPVDPLELLDLLFHLSWYNPLATHNFLLRKSDEAGGPSRGTEYQVQGGPPADSTLFLTEFPKI